MADISKDRWLADATLRLLGEHICSAMHLTVPGRDLCPVASAARLGDELKALESRYMFQVSLI
jgi:hypothetical protein